MEIFDPSLQGFLWVIAIGVTAIVIDVFFETELLSIVALLGISIYCSFLIEVDLKWRVLIALVCWLFITAIFYLVWKRFVVPLIKSGFTKGIEESVKSAIGATAEFRSIEGKAFVYWNGDLWPVNDSDSVDQLQDRDKVRITSEENGVFSICAVN
jgi:membrane protein implicated in regulation of membrane protease activity